MNKQEGTFLYHSPCPKCTSSDGLAVYEQEDGTKDGYCWACEAYISSEALSGTPSEAPSHTISGVEQAEDIHTYPIKGLIDRGLSQEVAEMYGVRVGFDETTGEVDSHYYPYYRDGQQVAYKKRIIKSKKFASIGSMKGGTELFGQHLAGNGGKMILITEGECDAMAATQMFKSRGKGYRVVSLPSGANASAIKHNLEWLESFQNVVLCFDQDEPGQRAAHLVADLLSPGKAKIMSFGEKDANEMLNNGKVDGFFQALMSAKEQHPAGIVSGGDTWDIIANRPTIESIPYPWPEINEKTYGIRLGELDTWTSGSGMGKTQVIRELEYHLLKNTKHSLGIIALEEPIADTIESLMALELNKRIHLPDVRDTVSKEDMHDAWAATSGTNRIHYFDHFGSVDEAGLISKIRYMAKGLDCKYIFLDHLSIVISEFADQGGERERIDTVMTRLKSLTQELNIWIGLIVHLRKTTTGGKGFEEGAIPSLDDLRGSGSIKQLSNSVLALARDQQAEDEGQRNTSSLHVLKCRYTGRTGKAGHLKFEEDTGRMVSCDEPGVMDEGGDF